MQTTLYMATLPAMMIAFHGLARKGVSDKVKCFGYRRNIYRIEISEADRTRWPTFLKDAEYVWISYGGAN